MSVQELTTEGRAALTELVVRGMMRGEVSPAMQSVVDSGLALQKGPIVMPAPHAAEVVGEWLHLEEGADRETLLQAFYRFLPLNRSLRELCTAWQCLPGGAVNDHSDPAYDAGIRDQFDDANESITPVLRRAARATPEFDTYAGRLQIALETYDGGKSEWLASPVVDSYHTVWMHIHQLFLLRLGISRAEDEALEEKLVSGGTP
jgi:hypothetical protein